MLGVPFAAAKAPRDAARSDAASSRTPRRWLGVSARGSAALLTNNGYLMREHFDALVPESCAPSSAKPCLAPPSSATGIA